MTDGPLPAPGRQSSTTHLTDTGSPGLAAAGSAGMVIFALTAHASFPVALLSYVGLALTALSMASSFRGASSRCRLFGLTPASPGMVGWVTGGVLLGTALAFLLRFTSQHPVLLTGLESFVITAVSIGAAEELLFRGFIQGRLEPLGWGTAVALAALAHTAYKVSLFSFPPEGVSVNLGILGFFTFLVGLLLGLLRYRSGSVIPAVASHVAFDVLVYGDWAVAPWWIWS